MNLYKTGKPILVEKKTNLEYLNLPIAGNAG